MPSSAELDEGVDGFGSVDLCCLSSGAAECSFSAALFTSCIFSTFPLDRTTPETIAADLPPLDDLTPRSTAPPDADFSTGMLKVVGPLPYRAEARISVRMKPNVERA